MHSPITIYGNKKANGKLKHNTVLDGDGEGEGGPPPISKLNSSCCGMTDSWNFHQSSMKSNHPVLYLLCLPTKIFLILQYFSFYFWSNSSIHQSRDGGNTPPSSRRKPLKDYPRHSSSIDDYYYYYYYYYYYLITIQITVRHRVLRKQQQRTRNAYSYFPSSHKWENQNLPPEHFY